LTSKEREKKMKGTLTVHLDVLAGGYELKNLNENI
jgi:hypothetical protein